MRKLFKGLKIAGIVMAIPGGIIVLITFMHLLIRESDSYIPQFMDLKMENTLGLIGGVLLIGGLLLAAVMFIAEES